MTTETQQQSNDAATQEAHNAEASAVTQGGEPQSDSQSTEATAAGSEPEAKKSPLDAVKAALAETAEQADKPKETEAKPESDPVEKKGKEQTEADLEKADELLPFNKHPRFRQLVRERKEARAQAEQYRESAERLQQFVEQVGQLDLEPPEYDTALNLASMAKRAAASNDAELAKQLVPHFGNMLSQLRQIAGEALPEDIQEAVDNGSISTEQAREYARLRLENNSLQRNVRMSQEQIQRAEQQRVEEQQMAVIGGVEKALTGWETKWSETDPDYGILKTLVKDRIESLMREKGAPQNVEQALKLADEARSFVTKTFGGKVASGRQTVRGPSGGASNGNQRPVPTSPRDVVRLALGGGA